MNGPHQQGITALELVVTMAVAAILLATGVPAFKNYSWNLRMRTAMDTLQTDLNLARSRAISHNTQTIICPATGKRVGSYSLTSMVTGADRKVNHFSNRQVKWSFWLSTAHAHVTSYASFPTALPRAATSASCFVTRVAQKRLL